MKLTTYGEKSTANYYFTRKMESGERA